MKKQTDKQQNLTVINALLKFSFYIRLNSFKWISALFCVSLTGFSLLNQFDLYELKVGLMWAWAFSGIIESIRLYTLYIIFTREKRNVAIAGYAALAAWCLLANSWAISTKVYQVDNQVDIKLIKEYQRLKGESVQLIKEELKLIERHWRINSAKLERYPEGTPQHSEYLGYQKARNKEKQEKLQEKEKINKYNPSKASEYYRICEALGVNYGLNFKYDTYIIGNGENASDSIFNFSEKAQKLIINLAIIILVEIGIFATARYAKSKNQVDKKSINLKSTKSTKKSSEVDVLSTDKKLKADDRFEKWLDKGAKNSAGYSGRLRDFAKKAYPFYVLEHPELLEEK
jgi:hypothetical protein